MRHQQPNLSEVNRRLGVVEAKRQAALKLARTKRPSDWELLAWLFRGGTYRFSGKQITGVHAWPRLTDEALKQYPGSRHGLWLWAQDLIGPLNEWLAEQGEDYVQPLLTVAEVKRLAELFDAGTLTYRLTNHYPHPTPHVNVSGAPMVPAYQLPAWVNEAWDLGSVCETALRAWHEQTGRPYPSTTEEVRLWLAEYPAYQEEN